MKAASMKVQTAHKIIEEYSHVFEGDLGTLEGLQQLDIDPFCLLTLHHRDECHQTLAQS